MNCIECNGYGGSYKYLPDDPTNKLMHGSLWYQCRKCDGKGVIMDIMREFEELIDAASTDFKYLYDGISRADKWKEKVKLFREKLQKFYKFAEDIRDGFDHDEHNGECESYCRMCKAIKLIGEKEWT